MQDFAYAIKDFDKHFEDRRSREIKELKFLWIPLDFKNTESVELLKTMPGGTAAWAVFVSLLIEGASSPKWSVGSEKGVRGILANDKGAYTPARLAMRTGLPLADILAGLQLLESPEVDLINRVLMSEIRLADSGDEEPGPPTARRPRADVSGKSADEKTKNADVPPRNSAKAPSARATGQDRTEQNSNSKTANESDVAAAAEESPSGGSPKTRPDPVAIELDLLAIAEPTRSQLLASGLLTLADVTRTARRAKEAGKGSGAIVEGLRALLRTREVELDAKAWYSRATEEVRASVRAQFWRSRGSIELSVDQTLQMPDFWIFCVRGLARWRAEHPEHPQTNKPAPASDVRSAAMA